MEVVIFEDQTWSEIPDQDNPAFDYMYGDRTNERNNECILISKVLPYKAKCVGENGYSVIKVPFKGDVISRGIFWNLEDAKLFANAINLL